MDRVLVDKLESIVSAPRLQRYRDIGNSDLETVMLYCWNIQLAESLMPSLAMFEVALRNAVHNTLTAHIGSDFWFKSVLQPEMFRKVADLIDTLTRRHGSPPTSGKVISEITFGFWPRLFAKRYNSLWWNHPAPLLADVIPNHPKTARDTRAKFQARLEYFVMLRNRLMHQEAIFEGVRAINRPLLSIDILHTQLLETIAWINSDAALFVGCLDHFSDTYHNGQVRIATRVQQQFAT